MRTDEEEGAGSAGPSGRRHRRAVSLLIELRAAVAAAEGCSARGGADDNYSTGLVLLRPASPIPGSVAERVAWLTLHKRGSFLENQREARSRLRQEAKLSSLLVEPRAGPTW